MATSVALDTAFDQIYLGGKQGPLAAGKLKMASGGIGWQNSTTKETVMIRAKDENIRKLTWMPCARGYELRIQCRDGIYKYWGFPKDAYDVLNQMTKSHLGLTIEQKDVSVRGYNWGSVEFTGNYMSFVVGNRTAFELPMSEISNTTEQKAEVSVEFLLPEPPAPAPGERPKKMKEDTLTEIRYYVPGNAAASQVTGEGTKRRFKDRDESRAAAERNRDREDGEVNSSDEEEYLNEEGEAVAAARMLYETIKQNVDASALQGDSLIAFRELLCLYPRGRLDIDFYADFFRLRGKSNDYKIQYPAVKRLFMLRRDLFDLLVIPLDPPIHQGQTLYYFLVFQIHSTDDDWHTIDAKPTQDEITEKYTGRLKKNYEGRLSDIVGDVFQGMTNKRLIGADETFRSADGSNRSIKCSLKASESYLFPLSKYFLFVPKPPTFIPHDDIARVFFLRIDRASTSRTFEIKFNMRAGQEYHFSNIAKEEYQPLAQYCKAKGLNVSIVSEAKPDFADDDDDDNEEDAPDGRKRKRIEVTVADEDSDESEDEDYKAESDSDPAEEFDEDHDSSDEGEGDKGGEPPVKKTKSSTAGKKSKKADGDLDGKWNDDAPSASSD
ncbi:hypothetical protein SeMB42_g03342 [Synchytrium endobioticum]|uniref:FACT complex subunit POB3 n=1 Tax=Synchytrium endobioticum TaxID=286115 RepID=A0A507DCW6_9FUNG|nr:hypothetical protein SeMB42_g03342 [Synchytrium endobioticum]TPX48688.1 hypothetical protein SeLEV6574_g01904 [Synchytrium endobioticum]